jgi:hypothetical protein
MLKNETITPEQIITYRLAPDPAWGGVLSKSNVRSSFPRKRESRNDR